MQDYQWFSWDCTVRKKVASSIWPNSTLHINPVSNRMHSFRTQWENKKGKIIFFYYLKIEVSCQPYKHSTFPIGVSDKTLQSKKENQAVSEKNKICQQTVTKQIVKAYCIAALSSFLWGILITYPRFHLHFLFSIRYPIQMTKSLNESEHTSKELVFPSNKVVC